MTVKLVTLITSFNRKEKTLEVLSRLASQRFSEVVQNDIFLTDDKSRDGTLEEVRRLFPQVMTYSGDGNLYWNRGMINSWRAAIKYRHDIDYFFLVNDDTEIFEDCIENLLRTSRSFGDNSIIVGSTVDRYTKEFSYGGVIQNKIKKLKFTRVEPKETPLVVDTFNANVVLIPFGVFQRVGMLDSTFVHSMGDFDYGLRAKYKGIKTIAAPNYHGFCSRNNSENTWLDKNLSISKRFRLINSVKGLPFGEWFKFANRHGGAAWLLYFLSPYIRILGRR
ncbi:glycosyltransferase family 2 protein [Deinococcus sp. 6GRE01]|uniref:glycosyltransferase family 2 protein n=1 Tax=Deinococcus sp. 6GRE01 TaxID=2745873 RepID=UPI001E301DC0|nr:glycosyltransferase family 2 protein [Deinococcus sp. 6GRE01]MCD0156956.1 glycosyltransferase family 2 protein [Deinococcus sp. 6GRE01]